MYRTIYEHIVKCNWLEDSEGVSWNILTGSSCLKMYFEKEGWKGILSVEWHVKGQRCEIAWNLQCRGHDGLVVVWPIGVRMESQGSNCQRPGTPCIPPWRGICSSLCWRGELLKCLCRRSLISVRVVKDGWSSLCIILQRVELKYWLKSNTLFFVRYEPLYF